MIVKGKMLITFNAILIALNVFLIYKNFEKQLSINELQSQIIKLENSSNNLTNSNINKISKLNLKSLVIENKKLMILTLIKNDVCGSCLINEIKFINKINSKYDKYIKVYYEGYSNDLKKLGANFEIIEVVNLSDKFQIPDNNLDNPASFVIDKNGNIQSYHKAIPGRPEVSAEFFEKIKSLFQSVYEN